MDKYTPLLHTRRVRTAHHPHTIHTHTPAHSQSHLFTHSHTFICVHMHMYGLWVCPFDQMFVMWFTATTIDFRVQTNKHTHTHIHNTLCCSIDRFEKTRDKNNKTEIELKRSHWFLFLVLFSSILSVIMQIQHCFSSFYLWYYIFVVVVVVVVDAVFGCRRWCYIGFLAFALCID